jgi:hypothetical protein
MLNNDPNIIRLIQRTMMTSMVGALLACSAVPIAAVLDAPEISSIRQVEDEYGSGGIFELEVQAPPNSMIYLERTFAFNLEQAVWSRDPQGVLSVGQTIRLSTMANNQSQQEFFRVVAEEYSIQARDLESGLELSVKSPTPLAVVLQSLQQGTGILPYALFGDELYQTVAPGTYQAVNVADLAAQLGVGLWSPPPSDDRRDYLTRYPGNSREKSGKPIVIPGDEGQGRIEDGWRGDISFPEPETIVGAPPPKPGSFDKPLVIEVPNTGDQPQNDKGIVPRGNHLRLVLLTDPVQAKLENAFQLEGDALPSLPLRAPEVDALVWVVRSRLLANQDEGIYYIGVIPNPWRQDTFNPPPPFRGAHEVCCMGETYARIPVPLLEKSDLSDLLVDVYHYVTPVATMDYLTPLNFLRYQKSFQPLLQLNGEEIQRMISRSPSPAKSSVELLGSSKAATITTLHASGPQAGKYNILIMGDGFADTVADQNAYNNYVQQAIMTDLLGQDIHPAILNAINFYRVNTFSTDSGVTLVDASGNVTTSKSTSLEYRYSGIWDRCWMEPGPNTSARMNDLINTLCPQANFVVVVLNVGTGGGCKRGSHFAVTLTSAWSTVGHEFGHLFGFLGDEYQCNQGAGGCGTYAGAEPGAANLTANSNNRATLKWREWVPPTRPIPTALANIADESQDVGVFPGAMTSMTKYWSGIFRPSWRGRMNNNQPPHNPVGFTAIRDNARTKQDADFRKSAAGDFNGDGFTDLVIIDGRQLSLYLAAERNRGPNDPVTGAPLRPLSGVLEPTWYHTDLLRNASGSCSWEFRGSDILLPGDFDGDGRVDLYVINLDAWAIPYVCLLRSTGTGFEPVRRYDLELPGWGDMRAHDEFYVGDFSGEGKADLMVYNGQDWDVPYFLLLKSAGNSLQYSYRYDKFLPGWEMGRHEKFYVGRYAGGAAAGVIAHNTTDWRYVHLMVFRSTGNQLVLADRYYNEIKGFWAMRRNDVLYPLDFNGDGAKDLAIFNGFDWAYTYLGLLASREGSLTAVRRYDNGSTDNDVNGWWLQRRDRFWVANVDGDADEDLVAYNSRNWDTEYLGIARSDGSGGLSGSWQKDRIDAWNLGDGDSFHVADFRGSAHWDDLFVFNKDWFGLLRGYNTSFQLEAIYPKWIYNHRYHANGWW